jgi:hypothetical protein
MEASLPFAPRPKLLSMLTLSLSADPGEWGAKALASLPVE